MARKPTSFTLFWRAEHAAPRTLRTGRVALHHLNVLDDLPPLPAIVLYPAFLTPAVHVAGAHEGMFEILIFARKAPALTASDVNWHLKIAPGMDPQKHASDQPLFANPKDNILVEVVVPDGNGTLSTKNVFHGQLHPTVRNRLATDPSTTPLGTYYAVRIKEGCLTDPLVTGGGGRTPTRELQDELIQAVLMRLNGPALRGRDGRGTHCFATADGIVDLSQVERKKPICALHPLFFYPAGGLAPASFGHVSDVHVSARQDVLRRSQARVIDDERALADSPPIGDLTNVCSHSLTAILQALGKSDRWDILLAGGDYVDHSRNVYPHAAGSPALDPNRLSPLAVWNLMDLRPDHGYNDHYQAFVDLVSFFTQMTWFGETFGKPIFSVTGNHDCYDGAFGISPRKLRVRANEGIPADHNLTFYEAILAFGETWDILQRNSSPFTAALFEWYYAVFTPFSDYAVELVNQRVVGLAWGEDEEIVSGPGSYGQGLTHLPRAKEAVTDAQLAVFNQGFSAEKKTVLFTHFTYLSYKEEVSELPAPVGDTREIDVAGPGVMRKGDPFSHFDMGTFERNRRALYASVADAQRTQFAITGHSHRKGLYFLAAPNGDHYPAEMHGFRQPLAIASLPNSANRTPIVVSDSAGPLPRRNVRGEFVEWGSDRPGGSLVVVGNDGRVASVEAVSVPDDAPNVRRAKPRLAVVLEYLHVTKNHIFDAIESLPFPANRPTQPRYGHGLDIKFSRGCPAQRCRLVSVVLYCRASATAPWRQIPLTVGQWKGTANPVTVRCQANPADVALFLEWLTMTPKSGRFMSMRWQTTDPEIDGVYESNSAWNIEVDARPSRTNFMHQDQSTYVIIPTAASDGTNPRPVVEAPSFEWRRRFPQYQ